MKKKRMLALLMLLGLLLLLSVPAYAESFGKDESIRSGDSRLPYFISDTSGLMTTDQWQKLENTAKEISEQYQCGVYVVTLDDYRSYGSYNSFWDFSEDFYSSYQLGLGERRNGILLIMSMADRDYSILAYGSDAHYAFTDYGKEYLENEFLDDFRRNDWYGGFTDYVNGCSELLERAAAGDPLDVSYDSRSEMPDEVSTAIIVGVPLLAGFGACEGMRHKMKPVAKQSRADEYVVPGGVNLDVKKDLFINRTVTRTLIQTENKASHSGGGGTTVNSSGFSGHSGKF